MAKGSYYTDTMPVFMGKRRYVMKKEIFLMKVVSIVGLVALLFLVPAMSETEEEGTTGAEVCGACHTELVKMFTLNPHAALDSKDSEQKTEAEFVCANCHGDASEHLKAPGKGNIFAYKTEDLVTTKTQACQSCHADSHPRFSLSAHANAGLDCTSCHTVHSGERVGSLFSTRRVSETCYECHSDTFAKFELNERHRLKEGIIECTSCHNPHEPSTLGRLAGFKSATCYECHTDIQGPYVYEHATVLIEGCVSCHEPHGSVNRHMLIFQKVANLCYSCHVAVPGFHRNFTADNYCTNCHINIHGSNLSPFFLE
jgi:DmsE family decaheme c-type cytochrome